MLDVFMTFIDLFTLSLILRLDLGLRLLFSLESLVLLLLLSFLLLFSKAGMFSNRFSFLAASLKEAGVYFFLRELVSDTQSSLLSLLGKTKSTLFEPIGVFFSLVILGLLLVLKILSSLLT